MQWPNESFRLPAVREKELVIVPTTCGTGSEVTNISILELTVRNTKFGLAVDELYPDYAVLIPELLTDLPYKFFATSSIDALVHSMESYLSPKSTSLSRKFSLMAIDLILGGYVKMAEKGQDEYKNLLPDFLTGSNYAGIAFGNAGTGYVHAMSYSFGATYHVPHGEANYVLFMAVFKTYQKKNPKGFISSLNKKLSEILKCGENEVYEELDKLLNKVLPLKKMSEYGVKNNELDIFTKNTVESQTRLTQNGYIQFSAEQVKEIYESVF